MSTPIRKLVKKALSPRIFKSPSFTPFLNTPSLTSDVQIVKSPSTIKSLKYSESAKFQNIKCFEQNDLEFCKTNLNNKFEEFIIHKPNKNRKTHNEESLTANELSHTTLRVPHDKDIPSVNTPEREEFLNSDLSKLNLNILGKGTFGTVVQAMYKDKDVALKIIRSKSTSLLLEANALNLNHPNILHVLLVVNGAGANHHLVVMQNCCALDLQHLLDSRETAVPFEVYSKWVLDVCSALQYCHQRGILHLDVKPKNILVKNNDCVLCDFGNSLNLNSLEQKKYYLLKVSEGAGGGTVAYSAPELLRGASLPTAAADVFALAVTMFHIHTRTPPFHFLDNVHSIIYQVVKHNLRPTTPVVLDICECGCRFRTLYNRCWAQFPAHRPALITVVDCLKQINGRHQKNCLNCCTPK